MGTAQQLQKWQRVLLPAVIVALLASGIVGCGLVVQVREASQSASHAHAERMLAAEALLAALFDRSAAMRGYLLAGDADLLEQRKAAYVGEYGFMAQLGYPSDEIKKQSDGPVVEDLKFILEHAQPGTLYLHNPCDRHDTHVATFLRCLEALRALPRELRPQKVYGCEVWRKLDWLLTGDKVMLRVDKHPHLLRPLLGVFDSQISGGKRYDLAEEGLRHANATYFDSHTTDKTSLLTFAMDLTPLVHDDSLDVDDFTLGFVRRLEQDVAQRLKKFR